MDPEKIKNKRVKMKKKKKKREKATRGKQNDILKIIFI
jgi:hypothetical protein